MKTLVLIRHSKSDWSDPNLTDIDRPLNKRGNRDAPAMAKILKGLNIAPDLIVSSPAMRAMQTVKYFAKEFDYDLNKVLVRNEIYSGGFLEIRKLISLFDDFHFVVFLFGHNPDITSLANSFLDVYIEKIPTTGIVVIDFPVQSWKDVLNNRGTLRYFEYPKKYFKKEKE